MRRYIYINEYGKEIEFSKKSGFRFTAIDGLSTNTIAINEVSGNSQIGATSTNKKIESKDITFEGDFKATYENRRLLIDTLAPGLMATIRIIDEDINLDVYAEGTPVRTPILSEDQVYQKFQFVFHLPFPFWSMTMAQETSFTSYISHFRFPRFFSNEISWKISERRLLMIENIKNNGTLKTGFTVVFRAVTPVTSPELLKIKTQEILKMNSDFVLDTGDVLKVSTLSGRKKVILIRAKDGREINAFPYLSDVSVFWQLDPGDNIVRYGADNNYEGLEVSIIVSTTLAGV